MKLGHVLYAGQALLTAFSLNQATKSYPRQGIAGIEEGAIPNPKHRRAQKQHSYQRDHKQQLIRELRKEAESTLLSAQGEKGFTGIRPSQAHSRDPHEAWE